MTFALLGAGSWALTSSPSAASWPGAVQWMLILGPATLALLVAALLRIVAPPAR